MTPRTEKKEVLHVSETGWAKNRKQRGKTVRTCLAPVEDRGAPPAARVNAEGNIVRGED